MAGKKPVTASMLGATILGGAVCLSSPAAADLWTEPQPLRREALMEGRDYTYGSESFLHRFSYRHLSERPFSDEDGVRGTAGSVSGDELFVDIHGQKTLHFDDNRHYVFLRMQRFEDFDGRYDRQIVGVGRRFGESWRLALAGDVRSDKAESDIQLEARWRPDDNRMLRMTYIAPEYFYNSKGDGSGEYKRRAHTLFVHYRHHSPAGWRGEVAVNYSPEARFQDDRQGVLASGDQLRLMVRGSVPVGQFRVGARLELERTDRDFEWQQVPAAGADDFRRRMHGATLYLAMPGQRWSPEVGVRHFRLREDGWFGTELATVGQVRRNEPMAYASVTLDTGERHQWQPTVYVSNVEARRRFDQRPRDNRDREQWLGKLSLPWRYTVDQQSGAQLTVNLSMHLHEFAFGGGNVQLHWPF